MSEIIALTFPDGRIQVKPISRQEKNILDSLIRTGDPIETAAETNSTADQIKIIANDLDFQLHIDNMRLRIAKSKSLDENRVKAAISDALGQAEKRMDKKEDLTRNDISILNLSSEVTGIKKNNLDVKIKGIENPYKDFSDDELMKLVEDRLLAIQAKKSGCFPVGKETAI